MIEFILPIPESVNKHWRPTTNRCGVPMLVRTAKANEYRAEAHKWLIMQKVKPLEGRLYAEIIIYLSNNAYNVDNALKSLLDSMEGFAYANDRQVRKCTVELIDAPTGNTKAAKEAKAAWKPHIEVRIERMESK